MIRTHSVEGVSVSSAAIAALAMVAWTKYTHSLGDWPAVASSLGPLLVWSSVLLVLLLLSRSKSVAFSIIGVIFFALLFVLFVPAQILGVVAVTGSVLWALPQLRLALSGAVLTGVSVTGYVLVFIENLGWAVYGFATGHYAYIVAPVVQGPASLLIAFRSHVSRVKKPAL
jgi:uncharacterized protein with PQ loop repeat